MNTAIIHSINTFPAKKFFEFQFKWRKKKLWFEFNACTLQWKNTH